VIELLRFVLRFDDPRLPESEPVSVEGDRHQFDALHTAVTAYVQDWLKQSPEHFNTMVGAMAPSSPVSSAPEVSRLPNPNSASAHPNPQEIASQDLTAAPSGKIFLQPANTGLAHDLFLGPLETKKGSIIQLTVLQLFDLATALDECAADLVELPAGRRRDLASPPFAWAGIAAILLLVVGVTTAVVAFLNRTNSQKQIATTTAPQSPSSNNSPPPTALQPSPLPTLSATPLPSLSPSEKLPLPPTRTSVPSPSSGKGVPGVNIPQIGTAPPNQLPGLIAPPPPPGNLTAPRQDRSSIFLPDEAPVPKASNAHPRSKNGQRQPTTGYFSTSPAATLPGSNNLPILTPSNPSLGTETPPDAANLRDNTQLPRALTPPDISKGAAFDSIPQVAEARNYFKQRWEPPSGLTQTLEYSLRLDTDGTIQRIIPLGEAARKYVDRSGMPLVGEHFVSPINNGKTPTIRVVLSPDGQVQTFLEST